MAAIPQDPLPDSTLALLRDGYAFIAKRCRAHGADLFRTRLMLTPAVCMMGPEAAAQFYQPDRFTRRFAMPQTALRLIQDVGSVMVMSGPGHRHRKAMFLSLMGPEAMARLSDLTATRWRERVRVWATQDQVTLFHEAHLPLTQAICDWAGVPLEPDEAEQRAREFEAMVEGTGSVGPRNWRGHWMRARTERWMRGIIRDIRSGAIEVPQDRAAWAIAWHRDDEGRLLDVKIAAVELINILRPTVANARYITFAAMALHHHPEWRERLRAGSDQDLTAFVHEVRRYYPFIPFIGGRVLTPFEWRGHAFAKDDWVLIDLYGTNRDPRAWNEPGAFRPERFIDWQGNPFTFIPQGGGDHANTHRCPGEWVTIAQMKAVTRLLVDGMAYKVPEQDLTIDLNRLPALPRSRFVISEVLPLL